MTIEEIDQARSALKVSQKALCARANVHPTTYTAIKNGRSTGTGATLSRLVESIEALRVERKART